MTSSGQKCKYVCVCVCVCVRVLRSRKSVLYIITFVNLITDYITCYIHFVNYYYYYYYYYYVLDYRDALSVSIMPNNIIF